MDTSMELAASSCGKSNIETNYTFLNNLIDAIAIAYNHKTMYFCTSSIWLEKRHLRNKCYT